MKRLRLIQVHRSAQVIVKCNSDIHFEHINQLEIINLTLLVFTEYHPTVTLLEYTAHTALLQNLILDGFGMHGPTGKQ